MFNVCGPVGITLDARGGGSCRSGGDGATGARGRCGRCGGKGIRRGYFSLRKRCLTCGYRFQREEGFLTGVFLVKFGFTLAVLFGGLLAWVVVRSASGDEGAIWPVLAGALSVALVVLVAIYPVAAATWAALDLAMRPLEPDEEAEAVAWVAAKESGEHSLNR